MAPRRKCFISYHHRGDQTAADQFVRTFDHTHDCFIARGLSPEMPGDVVDSTNTDYVMTRIRQLYIADSTVTIVLAGAHTWSRRYVDWEIATSLRNSHLSKSNGLLGIKLPTFSKWPARFEDNLEQPGNAPDTNYAGWIDYPSDLATLEAAIEWAYQRRSSHAQFINNSRARMLYNRQI
jgi:hypothetical protein